MKNRKLIVLDLDGTLLTSGDCLLLPQSELIMSQLIKEGHRVILTSGRPYRSMLPIYEKIGCHDPLIAYNGLQIENPSDPAFPVRRSHFKKEDIIDFYNAVKGVTTAFICESVHHYFSLGDCPYIDDYFSPKGMDLHYGEIDKIIDRDVLTCIIGCLPEHDEFVKAKAEEIPGVGWRHWRGVNFSELYRFNEDKANGLKLIREIMGFSKEDTIAIGDSDNDYEMLLEAGTAYCMKNCKSDLLREKFPQTQEDCHHDGAALELLRILGQ